MNRNKVMKSIFFSFDNYNLKYVKIVKLTSVTVSDGPFLPMNVGENSTLVPLRKDTLWLLPPNPPGFLQIKFETIMPSFETIMP